MSLTENATGVVLAGGESSRFERGNKALATLDGKSFICRVVETVASTVGDPVIVAVRAASQHEELANAVSTTNVAATFVSDQPEFDGPLAGLAAALAHVSTPWIFLTACDMPLLDDTAIEWLWTRRQSNAAAVVPHNESFEPLHAYYRTGALNEHLSTVSPSAGLHALVTAVTPPGQVSVADAPSDIPLNRSRTNVNTVPDLEAIKRSE